MLRFCLPFIDFKGSPVYHRDKAVPHRPFPGLVKTLSRSWEICPYGWWSCVYTHLMLLHTRVHRLSLSNVPLCISVCASACRAASVYPVSPTLTSRHESNVQWAWKNHTHTHVSIYTAHRMQRMCYFDDVGSGCTFKHILINTTQKRETLQHGQKFGN